jgi:putative glutamate/gamma-aminobutyrate antiporter
MKRLPRTLTVFTLAMINVAAIGSVKNWPVTAEYGLSSIFYLLLAALVFFIPVSLVSAELATGWPQAGGVYAWIKQAFGHRTGFLGIWLLWIENVIWYPTVLSFIGATIAYIFLPELANNKLYSIATILIIFWGTTLMNLLGMRISGWISTFGVLFGTFIPGFLIIGLGIHWYFSGQPLQITFTAKDLIPQLGSVDQMVFFTGVILSLCGMEMSAVHAKDVVHPQKEYPRAILLSGVIILGMSILGVLSIASVIPQKEISLVAGSLQAFSTFVNAYQLNWLTPCIAALIALGAIGSLSTWIVGPTRGLLAAAIGGDLPPLFRSVNKRGMPLALLLLQGLIVTLLSLVFLWMPSVSSAFWILSALVSQLYLIMYLLLFAAAIKLRYKKPDVKRAYTVPGGKAGMWVVAGLGIISSLFAIVIGYFPPSQLDTGNTLWYIAFLMIGALLVCFGPALILLFQKPHWKKLLKHEK